MIKEDPRWQQLGLDRADLESRIAWYTVPLLGELRGNLCPCGAGTLVTVEGGAYILTASHVWTEGLRRTEYIRLAIATGPHRFGWSIESTPEPLCIRADSYTRNGPDLCLIRIPDASYVHGIEAAGKVIHNLDARTSAPSQSETGVFAIAGTPAYLQSWDGERLDGELAVMVVPHPSLSTAGGFDICTFDIHRDGVKTFAGFSGGGVWWVPFENPSAPRLEGVVFWEEGTETVASIVSHGPESIRELCLRQSRYLSTEKIRHQPPNGGSSAGGR